MTIVANRRHVGFLGRIAGAKKEVGSDREIAFRGKATHDVANVIVEAEDFRNNEQDRRMRGF